MRGHNWNTTALIMQFFTSFGLNVFEYVESKARDKASESNWFFFFYMDWSNANEQL